MMPPPAVSVLLPVHDGARYLRSSIESVLSQDLAELELIIWDDASTDASPQIISEYHDPRVRSFRSPINRGLFASLNAAILKSSGGLLHLWSQDDIMRPDCLRVHVSFHEAHPDVAMSYSACDIIDAHDNLLATAQPDRTPDVVSSELAARIMFYHGSIAGNIANVMLTRWALERVGPFREDMHVAGDFEMWVRLSEFFPLGFVRRPLILLRSHAGQFSRRFDAHELVMREEPWIVQQLFQRLPPSSLRYAQRYNRRHRYLLYFHGCMRALLLGHWRMAAAMLRDIAAIDHVPSLFLLWLVTLDGHLFKMAPRVDELRTGATEPKTAMSTRRRHELG